MRSCPFKHIDKRFFSNRSLAYIQIRDFEHAFSDANMCIEIAPENCKGYCWKVYAVFGLIEDELFPPTMEAMGLASACIASYKYPPCQNVYDETSYLNRQTIYYAGFPGIVADNGGTAYLDASLLNRCGGGGVLSVRKGSFVEIKNSIVQNMRQMVIEARNEGTVKVSKTTISENQSHGISICSNGYGFIEENIIQENRAEGISCGGIFDSHESPRMNETGAS
ncbi:unnamed protein product [Mytilus coruscus]|uniref:Right handed beta helix domain-containing protein n=1 Tax=Mytilus coruscus TaxID=42192 RepID=A0A6J8ATC1_MYTCO|nr:unnamed protein product [Mytilus coruscus]